MARICGVSFLGSLQFYLISNFGVWTGTMYPHTLAGFVTCYVRALPFFGFTLAGDVGFSAVLFGAEAWLYGWLFAPKPIQEAAG